MRGRDHDRWASQVVEDNAADLLGYFLRRVGAAEDAADLLASLLLVIWRRRRDIPDETERARMWCYGAARNVLRQHHRGAVRREQLAAQLREHLTHPQGAVIDPAAAVERQESNAVVRAALAELDPRSREIVVLIHWDGFTIAQAAGLLRMNASTARTKYERARGKLSARLEADPSFAAGRLRSSSDARTSPAAVAP
jgi:RNA polymerase sigma-70 factor (ECF subfamily)